MTKANAAIAELKALTGKEAIFLQLDLADIQTVRKSAEDFLSYVPPHFARGDDQPVVSARRVSFIFSSITRE